MEPSSLQPVLIKMLNQDQVAKVMFVFHGTSCPFLYLAAGNFCDYYKVNSANSYPYTCSSLSNVLAVKNLPSIHVTEW